MEEQLSLLVIAGMELNQLCSSSIRKGLLYPHWPQRESLWVSFIATMTQSEGGGNLLRVSMELTLGHC